MDANHPQWVFISIGALQILALVTAINVGSRSAKVSAALQT
jgi:hypothetical protein